MVVFGMDIHVNMGNYHQQIWNIGNKELLRQRNGI